ncbi:hypothetical protein BJX99DRAFT_158291 [Aspergillus californicus]
MSSEDSQSESSTVVYDQEPFESFKTRVLELCQTVICPADGEISIERMSGGGFNRIIGVSVTSDEHSPVRQYILRVPRFEAAELNRDIAPLRLLGQQSNIPVPTVVAFDATSHNVLESPYMVQTRIPGSSLFPTYPDLPHETKCAVAKELGQVYSGLLSIRSATAGRLTLSLSQGSLMIQPFDNLTEDAALPYKDGLAENTTSNTLRAILEHKKEILVAKGKTQLYKVSFFDKFITTASEMSAIGMLDENHNCLCHLDLEPRNILASTSPTQPQAITGILDWDSAIFAPPLMSCSPPMWLWAWNDDDDEDERLADDVPSTPELREIKQLFEDAAGPTYRRFAYGAQYRLARKLIRFAIDGLDSNEDLMGAESLLSEWAEVWQLLKKEKKP